MASAFENIAALGRHTFYDVGGIAVTYARGTDTALVTAIPSTEGNDWVDALSAQIWAGYRKWLIKASDFASFTESYPKRGDTITDAEGNVWTVLAPDQSPVYVEIDGEGLEYQVSTKATVRA